MRSGAIFRSIGRCAHENPAYRRHRQLGREICRARPPSGTRLIAASRTQLDLSRSAQVRRFVAEAAPDLVINAAAYTAVERAEQEPDRAFAVNRDGAAELAKAAARCNAPIVHLSTDQVSRRQARLWTRGRPMADRWAKQMIASSPGRRKSAASDRQDLLLYRRKDIFWLRTIFASSKSAAVPHRH